MSAAAPFVGCVGWGLCQPWVKLTLREAGKVTGGKRPFADVRATANHGKLQLLATSGQMPCQCFNAERE
jgi:hypothetical protein